MITLLICGKLKGNFNFLIIYKWIYVQVLYICYKYNFLHTAKVSKEGTIEKCKPIYKVDLKTSQMR